MVDQIASLVLIDHNSAATVAKKLGLHQNTIRACLKKSKISHPTRKSDQTVQNTLLTEIRQAIIEAGKIAKRGKPWPDQIRQHVVDFAGIEGLQATATAAELEGRISVATIKVWLQQAKK